MSEKLIRHGTWAGYKAELETGQVCDRCRAASRVYNGQYSKANKAKGIKYTTDQVIDHLYKPGRNPTRPRQESQETRQDPGVPPKPDQTWRDPSGPPESHTGPTLADKLRDGLRGLTVSSDPVDNPYVSTDDIPDYITPLDADPEPGNGEWSQVKPDDEYVVTADAIRAVKDNLGTYLATVGMTLGIIDPYCGTAIRDNLDDMVDGWARVISHYPGAVKIFMAKGGGKIMAWIDALMATWPVLLAIYEHHLAKSVTVNSLGQFVRVDKTAQSPNGHFATQPNFDYTVE